MKLTRRFLYNVHLQFKSGYKENDLALTSLKIPLSTRAEMHSIVRIKGYDHFVKYGQCKYYTLFDSNAEIIITL